MKVIIMAGGKGTRITSVNKELPKPMIPILNKPILEYQIEVLRAQRYTEIILIVGHLSHVIKDYFGDGSSISPITGETFGINIKYIVEDEPLGTAGALYMLKDELEEDFLLLNGDIIFDIDIECFYRFHKTKDSLATIFTHPNSHPYDSGIVVTDKNSQVQKWLHKDDKRLWYQNRVNAGIHIFSPEIMTMFTELKKIDLDRDILAPLIETGKVYAYNSPEYVKDMGTPDRFYSVINDIETGKVNAKNILNKQKAIFLDRDGIINKYVGFLRAIDEFELIHGVAEAIKKINQSGFLAIVVTNQPVIARGEVSFMELQEIHNKMETLLGEQGAYLDDVFYCPHHPDRGYEGERTVYKIDCKCRKPKPGMLIEAAEKYNIDLKESWMIGDSKCDIEAGINAGCQVALISESEVENVKSFSTLGECIGQILN